MRIAARWIVAGLGLGLSACSEAPAPGTDAASAEVVAQGGRLYAAQCAYCHGARLEGQPNWRKRLPNGRLLAPPHDESGHTWHHPDEVLFAITKSGVAPPYAPKDYESDMPVFAGRLSDEEIWSVLAYIRSHWRNPEVLAARAEMTRNARSQ